MDDLEFLIIDFSSDRYHFHLGKKSVTYKEAFDYQKSLSKGWYLISPKMLLKEDRIVLENKLSPLMPCDFWGYQGDPEITKENGRRQGLYFRFYNSNDGENK